MGFFAPPALQACRVGVLHRFHPIRHPPTAFLRPLRVSSSIRPVALFHATRAHGVPALQSVSLLPTLPGSSPGDTLSAFLPGSRRIQDRALRAFCRRGVRFRPWSIASNDQTDALLGFFASAALCSPAWPRLPARHPPMTFSHRSRSRSFRCWPSASSRRFTDIPSSRKCRPL
jgi:hypothetical protein